MSLIQEVIMDFLYSGNRAFYANFLQNIRLVKDDDIETLCVVGNDGAISLRYNEEYLKSKTSGERMAVIEHELLHVIGNHSERFKERKNDPIQSPYVLGTDCAINQLIHDIPLEAVNLKTIKEILDSCGTFYGSLKQQASAEYYVNLLKVATNKMGKELNYKVSCRFFDKFDEDRGMGALEKLILNQIIKETAERSIAVPFEITKVIEEFYREPKLNWKQLLKIACLSTIRFDERRSWKRTNKRSDLDIKGKIPNFRPKMVLAIDTSGSIFGAPRILPEFMGQMREIQIAHGADIDVLESDCKINKEYKLRKNDRICNSFSGGGATSFVPVFDLCARKYRPSLLIYLTDGQGDFPKEKPKFTTIWCSVLDNEKEFPFGKYIRIGNQ